MNKFYHFSHDIKTSKNGIPAIPTMALQCNSQIIWHFVYNFFSMHKLIAGQHDVDQNISE